MKTLNDRLQSKAMIWCRSNPEETYHRTVIRDGESFSVVSRSFYEEGCSENEFICDVLAIWTNGKFHFSTEE